MTLNSPARAAATTSASGLRISGDITVERVEELLAFVRQAPFRFAKTMPEIPHEYTTRKETDEADFERFVQAIRELGYRAKFGKNAYTYLDLGGYRYWTMGWPVAKTIVLNRTRATPYHTALAAGVEITAPAVSRVEVDGSVAFQHDLMEGLPADYEGCDLLYVDLPAPQGLAVFDGRVGVEERSYRDFIAAVAEIVAAVSTPTVLTVVSSQIRQLPPGDDEVEMERHGLPAVALAYRTSLAPPAGRVVLGPRSDGVLIASLAERFERVGDFCCGYGQTGRIFREVGKSFVMSDYNAPCIGYIALNILGWRRP
jgi:hypothetical protein